MLTIADLYRTTEVQRWHIVKTKRKQSIAEHSYIVAQLSLQMAKTVYKWPSVNDTGEVHLLEVVEYALNHDIDEILLGDIPTPAKKFISITGIPQGVGGPFRCYRDSMPELVKAIVKLADCLEALKFLMLNKDSGHAEQVLHKIRALTEDRIDELEKQIYSWYIDLPDRQVKNIHDDILVPLQNMIHMFLHGKEFTIDDL